MDAPPPACALRGVLGGAAAHVRSAVMRRLVAARLPDTVFQACRQRTNVTLGPGPPHPHPHTPHTHAHTRHRSSRLTPHPPPPPSVQNRRAPACHPTTTAGHPAGAACAHGARFCAASWAGLLANSRRTGCASAAAVMHTANPACRHVPVERQARPAALKLVCQLCLHSRGLPHTADVM